MSFTDFLNSVKKMTNENAHNYARLRIAKQYNLKKSIDVFETIIHLHDIEGHMPYSLSKYCDEKTEEMFKSIPVQDHDLLKECL